MKTIINDIKEILIFIGFALKAFLVNFIINFFYIFLVIALTTSMFFFSVNTFKSYVIFIVYLLVLMAANYKIRSLLFFKSQLRLNLMYLYFLDKCGDFLRLELPGNSREIIGSVKMNLKNTGVKFYTDNLLMALVALRLRKGTVETGEKLKYYRALSLKLQFLQFVAFIVLFIPFGLISFLYTIGLAWGITFFVFLLGFFFVYFLNSAILTPMVSLTLTRRIYL